jgi:Outer membrane efflux protein
LAVDLPQTRPRTGDEPVTVHRLTALAALLAAAGLVLAQPTPGKNAPPKKDTPAAKEPPKPAPGSLEDTLDKALRNSADIKAAEAKVRDAEAELNRVRQQVLTKASALHVDLNLARRMLAVAEQSLAIQDKAYKTGGGGLEGVLTAQAMVEKHRGEVEKLETELKSLRGEFAIKVTSAAIAGDILYAAMADGSVRLWDMKGNVFPYPVTDLKGTVSSPAPAVKTPMLDRVKKLLDKEVEFQADQAVPEALQRLLEVAETDIPLRQLLPKTEFGTVSLRAKMPVGAWFQAIEDSEPGLWIVVRDYGLLLTTSNRVPDGALRVQDLWKGNYAELKKPADLKAPKQ